MDGTHDPAWPFDEVVGKSSRAFGFGRRMPIAQRYEPLATTHGEPAPTVDEQKNVQP